MKFEKTIKYSAKVEFDSTLEDLKTYATNKKINNDIKAIVDKAIIRYMESTGEINDMIEDGIKVTITKSYTTTKEKEEYD